MDHIAPPRTEFLPETHCITQQHSISENIPESMMSFRYIPLYLYLILLYNIRVVAVFVNNTTTDVAVLTNTATTRQIEMNCVKKW